VGDLRLVAAEFMHRVESGLHGRPCQVHRDALPGEEGSPADAEAGGREDVGERLGLKVDLNAHDIGVGELVLVFGDRDGFRPADRGEVDFEHGAPVELVSEPVSTSVVPRAEQHDLCGAGVERGGEMLVDEAVAQWHIRRAGCTETAEDACRQAP
jgi:hypothetical protein